MKLTPLEVDHVALLVFDVAASRHFYGELLELPLLAAQAGDDWGGHPWLMMMFGCADGRQLALCALHGAERPAPDAFPAETRHLAFRVQALAELDSWKRKLQAAGIAVSEEDHGDQLSLYFEDPNGIVLELTAAKRNTRAVVAPDAPHELIDRWLQTHTKSQPSPP